ncbi:TATA-binding protein-associated phosphoprotein [Entamoeba marina]
MFFSLFLVHEVHNCSSKSFFSILFKTIYPIPKIRKKEQLSSRKKRDQKAVQLSFLLFILNHHCSITYKKPKKKAKYTHQVFTIKTLSFDNETIQIGNFIYERCEKEYDNDRKNGLDVKKALRRHSNKRFVETTNMLVDICIEFGYFFDLKKSKRSKLCKPIDVIQLCYKNDKLLYNEQDIKSIGSDVSEYLLGKREDVSKKCCINKNETQRFGSFKPTN